MSGCVAVIMSVTASLLPQAEVARCVEAVIAAKGKPDFKGQYRQVVHGVERRNFDGQGYQVSQFVHTIQGDQRGRGESRWQEDGRPMKMVFGFLGRQYWVCENGGPARQLTTTELAGAVEGDRISAITSVTNLKDHNRFRVKLLPAAEIDGEVTVGLRVHSEGTPAVDLHFGAKSCLLRGIEATRLAEDGNRYRYVEVLSSYKNFSGVAVATKRKIRVGEGLLVQEETVTKVEFLTAEKNDDLFKMP